jgi:hypothetical protein
MTVARTIHVAGMLLILKSALRVSFVLASPMTLTKPRGVVEQ